MQFLRALCSPVRDSLRTKKSLKFQKLIIRRFNSTTGENLKITSLHSIHQSNGAKFTPYAGWNMPLLYKDQSHLESHHHTRNFASIFDVSHMLQLKIHGQDGKKFLNDLIVGDLEYLEEGSSLLSVLINDNGGIIDDIIISNAGMYEYFFLKKFKQIIRPTHLSKIR